MAPSKKKKGCASKAKKTIEDNCPYCLQWVPSLDTHLKYVNCNCRAQLEYDAQPVEHVDVPFDTSVPPPVLERAIQSEVGDIELEESDGNVTDELDIPQPSDDWGGGADGCLDDASMVFIQNGLREQHLTTAAKKVIAFSLVEVCLDRPFAASRLGLSISIRESKLDNKAS